MGDKVPNPTRLGNLKTTLREQRKRTEELERPTAGQYNQISSKVIGAFNHAVSASARALFVDADGTYGYQPSTISRKVLIEDYKPDYLNWLGLQPHWAYYKDDEAAKKFPTLIAEDLVEAGFSEFVDFDEDGSVAGIKYQALSVALHSVFTQYYIQNEADKKALSDRIEALESGNSNG